jgi:hypothetical protein
MILSSKTGQSCYTIMLRRLKLETDELVDKILSHYPEELWTSETTTFFDPAIGGGQFVRAVEEKLLSYGHSKENVASRVTGYEANPMRINYTVNKFKLVGKYIAKDFTESEDTKYDVILSAPPFEHKKSRGNKLWPKFVLFGTEMLKPNGYMTMLIPAGWTAGGDNMPGRRGLIKDAFRPMNLLYANLCDNKKYFPGIGSNVSWFILQNNTNYNGTTFDLDNESMTLDMREVEFLPNEINETTLGLYKKLFSKTPMVVHGYDNQKDPEKQDEPSETHNIKHWKLGSRDNIQYVYLPYDKTPEFSKIKKVLFPIRKFNQVDQVHIDREGVPVCQQGFYINVDNENLDSVESVFRSQVFRFITHGMYTTSFLKNNVIKQHMPTVPYDRIWTDEEMFDYFELTQEERDYIISKNT